MRKTQSLQDHPTTESGNSLIEVTMAVVVLAICLTAVAGVLGSSLSTSGRSKQLNRGARFLESTLSSLDAQSYDALLAMNGNVLYDKPTAAQSRQRIEITTSRTGIGLIQIELQLRQQQTGNEILRVATYRSQR